MVVVRILSDVRDLPFRPRAHRREPPDLCGHAGRRTTYLDPDSDLKIGFWRYEKFARQIIANLLAKNAASLAAIRSLYPTLTAIQIEDFPMVITKDGPVDAPRQLLNTINRASIDEVAK